MKLTIERSTLLSSLTHVQSVVERRNTIPILANVRIDAQGSDRLRLTATDMDLAVVDEADAAVEQEGAVTTTALTLFDIVRKLPDGAQVSMNLDGSDGGQLDVVSGRSRFRLSCLPIDEFPVMADDDLPHSFELPRDHLRRLIDKTRFAISTEETRYYLNGIHLHKAEDQEGIARLRAVATDGHRLSCADAPLPEGAADLPAVIVPRKTVAEVRKLIDDGDEPVSIALSETRIRFEAGAAQLTSKLIDGSFPDYERVIPRGNQNVMTVKKRQLRRGRGPGLLDLHGPLPCDQALHPPWRGDAHGQQPRYRHRDRGARCRLWRRAFGYRPQRALRAGCRRADR